jgi:membrane-associated phospholipid phosphatase/predicted protein tyrosine phosphatase
MRPTKAAAVWAAACSLLFVGIYGGCNWISAQRGDVGTLYFDWELKLPFVPAMILPYWSLDLFFLASFFLCSDRKELGVLGRRIVLAIAIAGACFLLFPLRVGFPRPEVSGPLASLFASLRSFDQPYNLLPSLHITLLALLADHYGRHTRGGLRVTVFGWFALIAVSTVLTYQHHVVDIAGGALLAVFCFRAIPGFPIGMRYAAGSLVALALAIAGWPLGALLLWPSLALALVAAGYYGIGAAVFGKTKGRVPLMARILLAPVRAGQYLSLIHYRGRSNAWDPIVPGVWIGRLLNDQEAQDAVRRGVTAVLDLTAEFSEAAPFLRAKYLSLPILDLTAPTREQLDAAVRFIDEQSASGIVYVHCKVGYSRSASVVGAWLLSSGRAASVEEAVSLLRRARSSIVIRPEAMASFRAPPLTPKAATSIADR